jgi:cell division septation protein DedD
MATRKNGGQGESGSGWIATILGMTVLVAAGFLVGLVVGVISEQPELMVSHLVGHDEEVAWSPDAQAVFIESTAVEPALDRSLAESKTVVQPGSSDPPAWVESEPGLPPVSQESKQREPSPPAPDVGLVVQVGAFSESGAAEKMSSSLRDKGYAAYVIPSTESSDGRWRVRVGPATSRQKAEKLARRLKVEERLPTWVVSEGKG